MFGKKFAASWLVGIAYRAPAFSQSETPVTTDSPQTESKRILFIIPNYRTSPTLQNYKPLTPSEKFKLASQDAFDRGTVALALRDAGHRQVSNANPSFWQCTAGFASYFAPTYADY